MLYAILIVIGMVGAFLYYKFYEDDGVVSSIGMSVIMGMMIAVASVLITLILYVFTKPSAPTKLYDCNEVIDTYELVALNDNSTNEINGDGLFFLGTGYISINSSTELYYNFLIKTDTGIIARSLPASNCYVNICDEDHPNPEITIHDKNIFQLKNKNLTTWFLISSTIEYTVNEAIIYIPEDAIINNYNIDLE